MQYNTGIDTGKHKRQNCGGLSLMVLMVAKETSSANTLLVLDFELSGGSISTTIPVARS